MAEVMNEYDWNHRRREANPYEWDKWLDGQVWKLEEGVDFSIKRESLINTAYNEGRCRGGKVRTSLIQGPRTVILQFYKP